MENIEDRLYRYRAKRLRFLINGDKFFTGINYALNTEKIRSYDALLNELTRSLSTDHIKLCKGVRYIFTSDGELISNLTDFKDGSTYICSSIDTFILTEYKINDRTLNWLVRNSASISSSGNVIRTRRLKQQQLQNQSNNNNNNSSSQALKLPQSQVNTPAKTTSHNINNSSNISGNNHNNHSHTPQAKPPISSSTNNQHIGSPNLAHSVTTPKRVANDSNNKLSHNNSKSNTPTQQHHNQQNQIKTIKSQPKNGINDSGSKFNKIKGSSSSPQSTNIDITHNNKQLQQQQQQDSNSTATSTSLFGSEVQEKYDIGRPIGDGHFSVVYCCMNKTTQEFCALKLIDKLKCRGRDDMIYNEVKILKQLNHPNIVKLIEEFDYPKQLYLILELVQDGDLFDAISTVTKFDEVHVATMIYNLSSALTYLHKQGIVHRDIKPENLLISVHEDGSQSVKLADFGLAVEVGDDPLYNVCGTAFYVSPEMLNETGYDYKVDVWSTGVICFILLCGYPPFTSENESNQDELFDAILAGDFQFAPQYWSKISQHAKNLIKSMLTVNPSQRFTAEQVFRNPWTMGTSNNFEGINPMNISRKIAQQYQ